MTPFNLVPTQLATAAPKLMLLAAVPTSQLTGLEDAGAWLAAAPAELWTPGSPLDTTCPPGGTVFWPASASGVEQLNSFGPAERDRLVVVSGDEGLYATIRRTTEEWPHAVTLLAREEDGGWATLPQRIWVAILEIIKAQEPQAQTISMPFVAPLRQSEASRFSISEWISVAAEGRYMPAVAVLRPQPVSGDLLVRPNQIILAMARGEIPRFDLEYIPSDPEGEAVALAATILRARAYIALLNHTVLAALSEKEPGLDDALSAISHFDTEFARTVRAALGGWCES